MNYEDGLPYYDRAGNRISLDAWVALLQRDGNRVALDEVGPYVVSTVWLGIDHGFGSGHRPLIFETMVFARADWDGPELGLDDLDCSRYASEVEALEGHAATVLLVRATTVSLDDLVDEGDPEQ